MRYGATVKMLSKTSAHLPVAEAGSGLAAYCPQISVRAAGRLWRLERAADLEALWEAMTADADDFADERLPYWTELWPSSLVLGEWLYEQRQRPAAGRDRRSSLPGSGLRPGAYCYGGAGTGRAGHGRGL